MNELTTPYNESPFERIKQAREDGTEFWSARDLMPLLGYEKWERFADSIGRAMASAANQGQAVEQAFSRCREEGTGGRPREDYELSRFAAYLVAMNGDPRKTKVAEAQAYFAIKTREAEVAPAVDAAPRVDVAQISRRELAQMIIEESDRADREALGRARAEYQLEQQQPVMEYHERYIAESDDIVTVDNFASQYGTTGPAVRALMKDKGVAVRRCVGSRWSRSKNRMEDEFEWRPKQGVLTTAWLTLRPQHNAPRLHNGQVRQTMYVLQVHAPALAARLGLSAPVLDVEGSDA